MTPDQGIAAAVQTISMSLCYPDCYNVYEDKDTTALKNRGEKYTHNQTVSESFSSEKANRIIPASRLLIFSR